MTTDTIKNWELNRTEPGIRYLPKIIDFLGYALFSPGDSFPEKLKAYRMVKGLTQRELAQKLDVDPTTSRSIYNTISKTVSEKRQPKWSENHWTKANCVDLPHAQYQ